MKRFNVWIIILLLLFVSIGNDRSIDVSDRTLVHAVGIDQDDSGCTVTLQIFKSDGAGSDTQSDPSKTNTRIISNTAPTFNEAMSLCEKQLGNYIFIGHNQVIVIGSKTDLSDPEELLSYFIRNKDNFLGVDVVLAENTAKEVLNVQIPTGTITMENFREIVAMYRDKGTAIPSNMVDFINQCKKSDKSAALPVISLNQQEESSQAEQGGQSSEGQSSGGGQDEKQNSGQKNQGQSGGGEESQSNQAAVISIDKNAVISHGKIVGELNPQETQCVNFIKGRTKYGMVTVNFEGKKIGVDLIKRYSKSKVKIKDNKILYNVDLSIVATTDNSSYTESDKEKIALLIESEIKKQCEDTFNKVMFEYNADIFDLCRLIRHYYPKIHLEYKDNFDVLKANTLFNINVKCVAK